MSKRADTYLIILLFAFLHATASLLALVFDFNVLLILTMLTMLMSVFLSMRQQSGMVFMVVALIAINFLGLWIGQWIGVQVRRYIITATFPHRHYIAGPLSTFLTTLIVGFIQVACARLVDRIRHGQPARFQDNPLPLILAFSAVLIVRMVMVLHSSSSFFKGNAILNVTLIFACSMAVIVWMAYYVNRARRDVIREKSKRHKAQYSYDRLKQQIEPHFLFNSLNTLGCIVDSGNKSEAMRFIHDLSSIYRYLLENEDEPVVYLSDEMDFVKQYIALMRNRFPEGLIVKVNVADGDHARYVVPCSLQLLVENAMKHNAVSTDNPLVLEISTEDGYLVVSNNRNPKITSQPSTGNGLKYIRNRYRDAVGTDVIIQETPERYTVKLPLL